MFFVIGGWSWVFWGVCARVTAGVFGHELIGYFAHNPGWWVLLGLQKLGLAWDLRLPENLPERPELEALPSLHRQVVDSALDRAA